MARMVLLTIKPMAISMVVSFVYPDNQAVAVMALNIRALGD